MKDKIEEILQEISIEHLPNYQNELSGIQNATDQLTALMCYREVRAHCKGRSVFLTVPNLIVALFKDSYSKEDILKAVEQCKKEME